MSIEATVPGLFQRISGHIAAEDRRVREIHARYRFSLGAAGDWIVDLVQSPGVRTCLEKGEVVDCTITCSGETFVAMATGKESPQLAFLRGAVSVGGDMTAALRLVELFAVLQLQDARGHEH